MRFQFTIRVLLLVTAVVATVFGAYQFLSRRHSAEVDHGKLLYYERHFQQLAGQNGVPFMRVVTSDTGQPVAHVLVEMTLIGPDGGDGGYQTYLAKTDGYATLHVPLHRGRYQYGLVPPPDSRFRETQWRRSDRYLTFRDGLCHPAQVRVESR